MAGHTIVLSGQRARRDAHDLIERSPPMAVVNFQEARRTCDQNALMWVLLGYVSRAKPQGRVYPPEIWKSLFMASCGHQVRWEPALDGNGVVGVGYRSSRLRKAEMGDLIECIYQFGAEHDVDFADAAQAMGPGTAETERLRGDSPASAVPQECAGNQPPPPSQGHV